MRVGVFVRGVLLSVEWSLCRERPSCGSARVASAVPPCGLICLCPTFLGLPVLFGKIKHLSALDRVLESLAAAGFCISAFKSSLDFLRIVMCFEEEDEVMGVYFPNELVVPTNQFFKKKKKS